MQNVYVDSTRVRISVLNSSSFPSLEIHPLCVQNTTATPHLRRTTAFLCISSSGTCSFAGIEPTSVVVRIRHHEASTLHSRLTRALTSILFKLKQTKLRARGGKYPVSVPPGGPIFSPVKSLKNNDEHRWVAGVRVIKCMRGRSRALSGITNISSDKHNKENYRKSARA